MQNPPSAFQLTPWSQSSYNGLQDPTWTVLPVSTLTSSPIHLLVAHSLTASLGLLVLLGIHKACFHLQAFPLAVPSSSILFPHNLLFQVFLFKCYLKNESFRDPIILNDIFILRPPPSHSPSILYFNSPIYLSLLLLSSSNRQNIFLISLVCCLPSLSRMYIMLHDGRDFLLFFCFSCCYIPVLR